MNSRPEIRGHWRGKYFYNAPEFQALDGVGIGFEMHLEQTRWQRLLRRFTGIVRDDPLGGVPGEGELSGTCFGSSIRFTKRFPEFYLGGAIPSISLQDYLAEHGCRLQHGLAHPPVFYAGRFIDDSHAEGTWIMHALTLRLDAAGSEMPFPQTTGRFVMERVYPESS